MATRRKVPLVGQLSAGLKNSEPGFGPARHPKAIVQPAAGVVRVASVASDTMVEGWLSVPFVPTGDDVGGWQIAARDGDVGVPEYVGTDPESWTFSLLLDGFYHRVDQHPVLATLLAMGKLRDGGLQPASVQLTGSVPTALADRNWLVKSMVPAVDQVIDDAEGALFRMHVAVTILAPVHASVVKAPVAVAKGAARKGSRTLTANRGEDLLHLLIRAGLGTGGWHEVAIANGIRDPSKALRAGTKVRV
jgi:hypothetical protein